MKRLRLSLSTLCMAVVLCALFMPKAYAMTKTISYVDENGETQSAVCTVIESYDNNKMYYDAGWYAVTGDVTIDGWLGFYCTGDVNLILCDGASLTKTTCFLSYGSGTLTIYGQSKGTGKLAAGSATYDGFAVSIANDLIVRGGRLEAITGQGSAAIYSENGSITVSGGSVTAQGGFGINASGGITISGGTVDVTATAYNALVAGNAGITITGGTVNAVRAEGATAQAAAINCRGDLTFNLLAPDANIFLGNIYLDDEHRVKMQSSFTIDDGEPQAAREYTESEFNSSLAGKTLRPVSYAINVGDAEHGAVSAVVENKTVTHCFEGAEVALVIAPDEGCELKTLSVRQGETDVATTEVDATHYTFQMPAGSVDVTAEFMVKPTHDILIHSATTSLASGGGSVRAEVGGTEVTKAQQGAQVQLVINNRDDEYTYFLTSLTVRQGDETVQTELVDATHVSFTMPDGDVTVTAQFSIKEFTIVQQDGANVVTLVYTVDDVKTEAAVTVQNAVGSCNVVIPDTIPYEDTNLKVTELSVSNAARGNIVSLTGCANVRTIEGNLFDWNKKQYPSDKTVLGSAFPGVSMSLFGSSGIPDTTATLAAIPGFIQNNYVNGAYYAGKCMTELTTIEPSAFLLSNNGLGYSAAKIAAWTGDDPRSGHGCPLWTQIRTCAHIPSVLHSAQTRQGFSPIYRSKFHLNFRCFQAGLLV